MYKNIFKLDGVAPLMPDPPHANSTTKPPLSIRDVVKKNKDGGVWHHSLIFHATNLGIGMMHDGQNLDFCLMFIFGKKKNPAYG